MKPGFMSRGFAALLFAAVAGGTTLAPVQQAHANDAVAAGVLGFIAGSLLPRPVYVAPAYPAYPVYAPAPVVVYEEPVYAYPAPVYAEPVYAEPVYGEPVYPDPYYEPRQRRSLADVPADPYYGNRRGKDSPRVVTYDETVGATASIEPWTPAWRDWCDAKFRTFDAKTGTYKGYDGKRHFCVVK